MADIQYLGGTERNHLYHYEEYTWFAAEGPDKMPEAQQGYMLNIDLIKAVRNKADVAVVAELLDQLADPFLEFKIDGSDRLGGWTAFDIAIEDDRSDIIMAILQHRVAEFYLSNPNNIYDGIERNCVWGYIIFQADISVMYQMAQALMEINYVDGAGHMISYVAGALERKTRTFDQMLEMVKMMIDYGYECSKRGRFTDKAGACLLIEQAAAYRAERVGTIRRALEDHLPILPLQDVVVELAMYYAA